MLLHRLLRMLAAGLSASARVHGVLFVGAGNRFDDDRRLVRIAAPARRHAAPTPGSKP